MSNRLRLLIEVESNRRLSWGITGKFEVSDMILSEFSDAFNETQTLADVKKCIRVMKGFNMLTMYLYEGSYHNEREVHSIRYVNDYGTITKSAVDRSRGYAYYDRWETATLKDMYEDISIFVRNGNMLRSKPLSDESSTEVATAQ